MLSLIVELKTIYGEGTSHENDLILGSSNRISSLKKNEDYAWKLLRQRIYGRRMGHYGFDSEDENE